MSHGFWKTLPRPFFCLAPMAAVTDAAFRRMFAKYGKPDVMWTEFVSADGLFRGAEKGKDKGPGYENLAVDLEYTEAERPIVAQFFSPDPKLMERAGKLAVELGFDGVDINMGCPEKNICKQGSGAALIQNPKRAREIIAATKAGAGDLPVSVKTRIGFNTIELEDWLPELLAEEPAAVILHARTRKEMSKVPAHWDQIQRAVEIRDEVQKNLDDECKALIIGNGDVETIEYGRALAEETGCDGIMIGRGLFGNPHVFTGGRGTHALPIEERLEIMLEHTRLFDKLLGKRKNFALMKKHYKAYVEGFPGAKELRTQLMETNNVTEVKEIVKIF